MGLAYSELNLIGGDSLKIRPFTAGDQKVMAVRGADSYRIYFNLLSRVIVSPEKLDLDQLLISDANAILFAVRLMSFGPDYTFNYKCDNCDANELVTVNLSEVEAVYAEADSFISKELTIKLPNSNQTVTYHLPTLADEKVVNTYVLGRKKKGEVFNSQLDPTYVRIAQLLDEIPEIGNQSLVLTSKLLYLNDKMSLVDLNILIDAISNNDIGIKGLVYPVCSSCGWENKLHLGINEEFFRPNAQRV